MSEEKKESKSNSFEVEKPSLNIFNDNDIAKQKKLFNELLTELLGAPQYCLQHLVPEKKDLSKILYLSSVNHSFKLVSEIIDNLDINIAIDSIISKLYKKRFILHRVSQILLINIEIILASKKFNDKNQGGLINDIKNYAISNIKCYQLNIDNIDMDKCIHSCINKLCNCIIKQIRQVCNGETLKNAIHSYCSLLIRYNKNPVLNDNEIHEMREIIFKGVYNDSTYVTRTLNKTLFNKCQNKIGQYLMSRVLKEMSKMKKKKRKSNNSINNDANNNNLNNNYDALEITDCIDIDNIFE